MRDLMSPRRTLYITTIRADRATYQMFFDAADPNAIVEKRTESTVAPQALWLLNHPFALAQAKALTGTKSRTAKASSSVGKRPELKTAEGSPRAIPQELRV